MQLIKTSSFSLAVYQRGDANSNKLALVLPGRLDTKDYPHMRSHVDFLASKGYLALSFDPPGTWESPGGIELYTMTNWLKAINELIDHFGSKPTVLFGHSRGGTMAMLAGARNKCVSHIIAVMSHPSPSSLSAKGKNAGVEVSYRDNPFGGEKREFLLPLNYFEDAKKYDLLKELSGCTKSKLLGFGKKDVVVTPAEVREVFARAAPPKEIFEVDSGHDYRRFPELIEEVNVIIGKFLDKK